jgi:bifunctional enzyme CysN/CysC
VSVGDKLIFYPTNKTSVVKSIERWSAPASDTASAGESVGLTLAEQILSSAVRWRPTRTRRPTN